MTNVGGKWWKIHLSSREIGGECERNQFFPTHIEVGGRQKTWFIEVGEWWKS